MRVPLTTPLLSLLICLLASSASAAERISAPDSALPGSQANIQVARDGLGFTRGASGPRFVPWGQNYGPEWGLLEDRWETDWPRIAADFRDMRELGANVVRVHLQ